MVVVVATAAATVTVVVMATVVLAMVALAMEMVSVKSAAAAVLAMTVVVATAAAAAVARATKVLMPAAALTPHGETLSEDGPLPPTIAAGAGACKLSGPTHAAEGVVIDSTTRIVEQRGPQVAVPRSARRESP